MKFFYAKKELKCHYDECCYSGIIQRNSFVVRTMFFDRETGLKRLYCYHAEECYSNHLVKTYHNKYFYWKAQLTPRKKIGRPAKCYDSKLTKQRAGLMSLMIYHRNLGHTDKVNEILAQITELERR